MSRFVLPTTRRIYIRSVVHELLWFLKGIPTFVI
ncbi:thymidylate synthase [Brevibacillus thermoruber]